MICMSEYMTAACEYMAAVSVHTALSHTKKGRLRAVW